MARTPEQKAKAAQQMREYRARKGMEWRRMDSARHYAYRRAWALAHKERIVWYSLTSKYGITKEQYETAVAAQGGLCILCRKLPRKKERLVIDHDHKTNKVRGFMCRWCNMALGSTCEDVTTLQNMINYITEHSQ